MRVCNQFKAIVRRLAPVSFQPVMRFKSRTRYRSWTTNQQQLFKHQTQDENHTSLFPNRIQPPAHEAQQINHTSSPYNRMSSQQHAFPAKHNGSVAQSNQQGIWKCSRWRVSSWFLSRLATVKTNSLGLLILDHHSCAKKDKLIILFRCNEEKTKRHRVHRNQLD